MRSFSIIEDLEGRPMIDQVEILWISGPSRHDADMIASMLELTKDQVLGLVREIERRRK